MPPPYTRTTTLLQSHHAASLVSSPRINSHHTPTRTYTRPTRSHEYRHHRHNPATYQFLLQTQSFSTSSIRRREKEQSHYEILDVPITASAAEIKKKFYALSLRHHPDRNRTDPNASQRFAKISSAYSVLSNPQKRSTYDRDHGFHRAHTHHHPQGSHSSHTANLHKSGGGYAGSRPASGLSNRRGTFRGPPPSFYEQGGYGGTGRKGDGGFKAGQAGPGTAGSGSGSAFGAASSSQGPRTQTDPEDPMGFIHRNPLHHFNARGHFRTQKAEDERRRERASRARSAAREKADSFIAGGDFGLFRFVFVCGILVAAGAMTGLFQWPAASSANTSASGEIGGGSGKTGKKR
ncbi:DnAJ-like protein [Penicillium rolfsii]|nr:DnAJ-like protein [Penicillium rolfsii]